MKPRTAALTTGQVVPIVGLVAVVTLLLFDVKRSLVGQANHNPEACAGPINDTIVLSREQLAAFLTISERDTRARVQEVLPSPYCQLASLEVRAGVQADRAVYPLAFDPHTWLIVLYEGDEYAGYQFRFFQN